MTGAEELPGIAWRVLDPRRDAWLDDHRPGGRRIVPGAVVAAWMIGALPPAGGSPVVLADLRWSRPLRVADAGARYRIESGIDGARTIRLLARRRDGRGREYGEALIAHARAGDREAEPWVPEPVPEQDGVAASLPASFHGATFRCLGEGVRVSETGLDAEIVKLGARAPTLPLLGEWPGAPDSRHLDALFQACGAWRALAGLDRGVPAELARLEVRRASCAGEAPLRVRLRRAGDASGAYDIWCGTAGGRTVLCLRGYRTAATVLEPRDRGQRSRTR